MDAYIGPVLVALIVLIGAIGASAAILVGILRWIHGKMITYRIRRAKRDEEWRNRWH